MQSALKRTSRFSQLFRLRSAKFGVPSTLVETQPPLFQKTSPWWARWAWGLIACDVFLTGSAIELTYKHWSTLVSDLENSAAKLYGEDAPTKPKDYALRPSWQRLGLCAAHLTLGAGVAAALLVTQVRLVRTIAILPPSGNEPRRVFIQCAHNFKKNGIIFPINKCTLKEGRNETEMIFRATGERGHWHIGLEDAIVRGQPASPVKARAAILADWGGKRVGHWTPKVTVDSRWKSGPVRRAER
ncbi:hypothetical protein Hypma_007979 [Hypsizygus marmoreus]|uniref:Uncharacterized protein n=1 Tax=Hypsizygus marmoreus TaxID=39966 RepID=A0A369JVA7_HYPMA|nr:hypothetical protein Hypma_007979 [Hypsizygus marmoreus]